MGALVVALVGLVTVVGLAPSAPVGAAPAGFTLDMVGGQGQVNLGASPDSPLMIASPSKLTGTIDDATGAITGGSLSTPPITFTQQITTPVVADVEITATFSDTTPNSGTGQVDGLGNVSFSTSLDLDLHIDVGGGLLIGECQSAPIVLDLVSIAPYDPELQEVTLTDPGFAIPEVAESSTCSSLMTGPVNDQLSSANNSITLGLIGALPLPPPPGDPSTTALVQDKEASPLGHPVTFTATVEPSDATGTVTFLSGTTSIGIVPVGPGGVAALTTSSLPVGSHSVTARYSGDLDHRPSTSAPVTHTVTAIPNVTADLPPHLVVGAAPTEFTATISNPASGGDQASLRLDWRFGRVGTATNLTGAHLTLEHWDGTTWVAIPLARRTTPLPSDLTGTVAGSYGGLTGFALAAGQTREARFRIAAAANAPQGPMAVEASLKAVDSGGLPTTTFTTTTASTAITSAVRRSTTSAITVGAGTELRQGFSLLVRATVTRGGTSPAPNIVGGNAQILIDGRPVEASTLATAPPSLSVPVGSTGAVTFNVLSHETRELTPGKHRVSVRFLGDLLYLPSLSPEVEITVHAQAQPAYECTLTLAVVGVVMGARVDIQGTLPAAAPAGSTVSPFGLELIATIEEGAFSFPVATVVSTFNGALAEGSEGLDRILEVSPEGSTGTYGGLVSGTPTAAPAPRETTLTTGAPVLTIPIEGEPGDVVDVRLERFGYEATINGDSASFTCVPVDEPVLLGSVVVAGTTLSSSASGAVEEGSPVVLSASVFPASAQGMVEFFDGESSLGFAPVVGGVATLPTSVLPQGRRSVTARYLGDLVNVPSVSAPVEVLVRDVILCKSQGGTESGAVVRATYLLLLGRCAEPSGFAYWRGRLDGGLSAEAFARQIASSLEAHGRSVDDGYQLVLGRAPDAAGRAFWARRLHDGRRYDLLLGDLAASGEFWNAAGATNSGFVTRLYDRFLHRSPDAGGLSYWTGRLNAGVSRASVAAAFVRLAEPTGAIVTDAYAAILDRAPTGEEKAPAVAAFQADGHRWKVYAALIGTGEFHDRAQTHPNA